MKAEIKSLWCAMKDGHSTRVCAEVEETSNRLVPRTNIVCVRCHNILLFHTILQIDWSYDVPPFSGYYLVTWYGGTKIVQECGSYISSPSLIVSELWFNPDAGSKWWVTDHARIAKSYDATKSREIPSDLVIAWRTLPEPASLQLK